MFGDGEYSRDRTGLIGGAAQRLGDALLSEADRWFLWVPVLFGAGIGIYFALDEEPAGIIAFAAPMAIFGLLLLARGRPALWACFAALLCVALGFSDAKLRAVLLSTPVLERASGAVILEGWVERSQPVLPKGVRLTLRITALTGKITPAGLNKVRLTSRYDPPPQAGTPIRVRAILRPVPEPVSPGGFDFSRKAWFNGIGAVGFAISAPAVLENPPLPDLKMRVIALIDGLRKGVDGRIRQAVPGPTGAIASALITGERGRIPKPALQALRHSGLAHVLAISGLHMALMAGALYWLARAGLAMVPQLALRLPVKKIAAVMALLGGGFYLALSGGAVATQRAYLMMAIFFLAVLLDRPALTLRNVALAAIVILALYPESLFNVSFQMSFAATAALISVYERWGNRTKPVPSQFAFWRGIQITGRYFTGIALTTMVAGLAVAPFAIFHFHKLAQYSLIGNLAAMPLVGICVMPMALASLIAMPFGLEYWPLQAMGAGIETIVEIAGTVSGWDGAVVRVGTIPVFSLLALVLGGLWLTLWRERWRLAGLVIAAAGLATSGTVSAPDILVDRDGAVVAVRGGDGQLTATPGKGGTYSLERWLASNGDARTPREVRALKDFACDDLACVARVRGKSVAFLLHPAALREECASADIVVAKFPVGKHCKAARVTLDRLDLSNEGAHAFYLDGQSIRVESVAGGRGNRPWTRGVPKKSFTADTARGRALAAD